MLNPFLTLSRIALFVALVAATAPRSAQGLIAGAATSNITPPLGMDIVGGFSPSPSTNVHDELHARCLVLDDGQARLALVVCDLLGIGRLVSDEARKLIDERLRIPPSHVLISAIHAHSASSAMGNETWLGTNRLETDASDRLLAELLAMTELLKISASQR